MKLKKKDMVFYIAYSILFISLFIRDIDIETDVLTQMLRYTAYILLVFQLLMNRWQIKKIAKFAILIAASMLLFWLSKDMYWASVVLIIFAAKDIEMDKFIYFTYLILFICTLFVVLLCFLGVLPDVLTARTGIEAVATRHSFGFYHSDVLPVICVYLMIYYLWMKNKHAKTLVMIGWAVISLVLYYFCGSRNAFYATSIVIVMFLIFKYIRIKKCFISIFEKISYFWVALFSAFSLTVTLLLSTGSIYDTIDTFFSGRFRVSGYKIMVTGLHFINVMSNDAYFNDKLIIDNGYMYIILRYGLVAIIFYLFINYLLVKKANKNPFLLICVVTIFLVNMIDNDLCDYNFLPFIIIAFNGMKNVKFLNIRSDTRS